MKYLLVSFTALLLLCLSAYTQTIVSDNVTSVWNPRGNPYIVSGNVTMFPLMAALPGDNDQRPDSAQTIKSTFYRPERPSPWGFGVSGSLVVLLPAERFYGGFHSAPGAHFSFSAFQRDLDGRTNGFTFCVSFQFAKLSRDVEKTSSVGFPNMPQFETSQSVASTQIALELGRASRSVRAIPIFLPHLVSQ